MSKKFVRVKKFIIPILTTAMLLSQAAPAFALAPAPAGLVVAEAVSSESDFVIKDGVLVGYTAPWNDEGVNIVIPDGVTEIGSRAFDTRMDIRDITIPDGVTKIASRAFNDCYSICELRIPNSVVEIGENLLGDAKPYECDNLVLICAEGSVAKAYAEANGFRTATRGFKDPAPQPVETTAPITTPQPVETPVPTVAPSQGAAQVSQRYTDVPTDFWGYKAIEEMSKGGLLSGYGDGRFGPNDPITTGELATILCRIGGLSTDNAEFKPGQFMYTVYDKPYNWAHMALRNVWSTMIYMVEPKDAERLVLRGEAITALEWVTHRMPKYFENGTITIGPMRQVSEKVWTEADIPDWDKVKQTATDAMAKGIHVSAPAILSAYNLGIISGIDSAGTCVAEAGLTRAELCQILYNMGVTRADSVDLGGAFFGS